MTKKKVAIIGAGTIGTTIATEINSSLNEYYELVGLMKNSKNQVEELKKAFNTKIVTDFSELLQTNPDIIIEAAAVEVVQAYGEMILEKGIDFIPLSVGGLANEEFYSKLQETAQKSGVVLYIPSGAIGGFDLMRKMTLVDKPEVEINTYKSPSSLSGAPHLEGKDVSETEESVVFDGTAKEAIKGFPKNINVAVATALATVGPENTRTKIHSDPELKANIHHITVKNQEGTADIRFTARPSDNARTSSITPWSVISLLKNIAEPVRFF